MKKLILTLLLCFLVAISFGQTQRKISLYLSGEYTETLYDRTRLNNPWSAGLGVQGFLNNTSKFKPTIDITATVFLMHFNILYLDESGKPLDGADGMVNAFAGVSYHPTKIIYASLVGGPSFINGETHFGIKPSFGVYFSRKQKLTAKVSYLNVFNRINSEDLGAINISLGVKLF
ncbi:MAG TPA: hypothetical protein VD993_13690 [Chitinophagaceae bacterium]|nr:hypothetical protein [Chitinophagaceae bacterium]